MNITSPEQSPLFARWCDPVSGVESLILSGRVAPLQQSFYYTNPSFTADGRFLWFRAAFPPGACKQAGVVDFAEGTIRLVPEVQQDGGAHVDPASGTIYWATGAELWKRGPLPADRPVLVNVFPADLVRNRRPLTLATHLIPSADGKSFFCDAQCGREWICGDLPLDGSPFRVWQTFDHKYDHAQFSPTDPDLALIAQDHWWDPVTGEPGIVKDRLWLIRRGEKARPILPDDPLPSANRGHEWWDADGEHVWYLDYTEGPKQGTKKVNIHTGRVEAVWPHGHSHSHCDRTGRYLVGDIVSWPADKWQVAFYNAQTRREVAIVTLLPPCGLRSAYHVHPHPQFCLNDRYVCYTTNVLGTVDLALTPVEQLARLTA